MELGIRLPTQGNMAAPGDIAAMARRGEELGFSILSIPDHVVIPRSIDSTYPYSESGAFGWRSGDCLEQLTTLGFLAGQTASMRLLTSVMVLPHRHPVLTAKILATIDVLSGGRLIVGCGVGWMREEFEVLDAPPFDERGAVGDEYIRAFRELWTSDTPSFQGEYCNFSGITFEPKPVQKPHPPIWIGGESPAALRRAGRLGDGWYPLGSNPRFPVAAPEQLSQAAARVRRHAEEAGRDPGAINVAYSAWSHDDVEAQTGPDGRRRAFTGTPQQLAGDIHAFEEAGARQILFSFQAQNLAETLERMERFADRVMPLL